MTINSRALPTGRRFPPPMSIPKLIILLLVFIGMALVGNYLFQRVVDDGEDPAAALQTATVGQRTIESTVSSTGTVAATQQVKVTFGSTGQVQDVYVKQGDQVEAGQPLAALNPFPLEVQRDTAQSNLSTAQLKLDELLAGPTSAEVASAQQAVTSARSTLTTAQNTLNNLIAGADANDVAKAQATLDQAKANLDVAQSAWDKLANGVDLHLRTEYTALQSARAAYQTAQANYATVTAPANSFDVSTAQGNVTSAQAALDSARASLADVLAPTDPLELADARNAVTTAEAALTAAQAKLQETQHPTQSTINISSLEAALAAAEANLRAAESAEIDSQTANQGGSVTSHIQAEAGVVAARAQVQQAHANLSAALTATSPSSADVTAAQQGVTTAQANLTTAQNNLVKLQQGPAASDLAAAQQAVTAAESQRQSAQNSLDKLVAGATPEERAAAQVALDNAKAALDVAQTNWDRLEQGIDLQSRTEYTTLIAARASYQTALSTYNTTIQGPKPGDVAAAQASVEAAMAMIASTQAQLDQVLAGSTDTELGQAGESVKIAELALEQAQYNLDHATVSAPYSGTIVSVGVSPGDQATATTAAFTLLDPSLVRIDATVDEANVVKLRAGMPVNITFDAIQGRTFQGNVATITPSGTASQGVVTFPVTVVFNTQGVTIPPGTTANLSFVTDSKSGVLAIPSRAIQRQGQSSVVQVMVDGKPEARQVTTGLSGSNFTEITSGLSEGETVVIGSTLTAGGQQGTGGGSGLPSLGGGGAPPGGGPVFVPAGRGGGG
ncbi:MAG: efflux RND transporter periplasmic adaptor subunit [Dehalococcoidia bacterium]